MPRRERPEPPERGSLRWRILARRKFFWKAGDIELVHEGNDSPGRASGDPREEDDGNPDPGRG